MKPSIPQRIINTNNDIANFNRDLKKINGQINALRKKKIETQVKIGKKHRYRDLLLND